MSVILGVIPININRDVKKYILNNINDKRVEVAQHGTNHTRELQNFSELGQYIVLKTGFDEIIKGFNVYPVTFIPPYNSYDVNTMKALSKLGFKVLSADKGKYKIDKNIMNIGYTVTSKDNIENILSDCNKSLNQKNICVVIIHPQDYLSEDQRLNDKKYIEFVNMLDKLNELNIKFATFKDLIKCKI
jgi:hypothetical protein